MAKKIVTIGGGKGQSTLLRYLRNYDFDISAVVTVMDNGRSSGFLREQHNIPALGDMRRCIAALADNSDQLEAEWNMRDENDMAAGNLVLLSALQEHGSVQAAVDTLVASHASGGSHHYQVLAVTEDNVQLEAKLENGQIIHGEEAIDVPSHDTSLRITELTTVPQAHVNPRVQEAIAKADAIIFTMGDLYTSVLANCAVEGVSKAIAESAARVMAICNRAAKPGETEGFTVQDVLEAYSDSIAPAQIHALLVDDSGAALPAGVQPILDVFGEDSTIHRADLVDEEQSMLLSGEKVARTLNQLLIQ